MTRKHFEAIADVIALHRSTSEIAELTDGVFVIDRLIESMADMLAQQNPRFNRAKWVARSTGDASWRPPNWTEVELKGDEQAEYIKKRFPRWRR